MYLAKFLPAETRAEILFHLDRCLRQNINDEEIFMVWLEQGVPDGTEDASELTDVSLESFLEMWNLAHKLLEADAEENDYEGNDEPDDIDDDMGYNPYTGCMDWDC
jgi:hypothetical protein